MRISAIAALLVVAAFTIGLAQAPSAPATPSECLKAVQAYPSQKAQEAKAAGLRADYAAIAKEQAALAGKYAAQFLVTATPLSELKALAQLHGMAGQVAQARQSLDKGLHDPTATTAIRAELLATGVDLSIRGADADPAQAERYAADVDALGSEANGQKLAVHARLGGHYRAVDVDAGIVQHYTRFLALYSQLSEADRATLRPALIGAYESLAEVYGGRGEIDKALATLQEGLKATSDVRGAQASLQATIERYQMVGKPGGAIEAATWFNAKPGTTALDLKGRVRILEFTAHWCGPCRKSYPAMKALYAAYRSRPFDVVFVTQLYGFVGTARDLTPDQEVAADREYFLGEHKIAFPVAVEMTAQPNAPNSARYHVAGIPQIVVVDKRGVVRRILIGWDPANETPLRQLVEQLLAEQTPGN